MPPRRLTPDADSDAGEPVCARGDPDPVVRVSYVAQSLGQMRKATDTDEAHAMPVHGPGCVRVKPCEIPLPAFAALAGKAIDEEFVSACTDGQQVCPAR